MANRREIIKRRKSVSNIRKITNTMRMIATAQFKKALGRALGARAYTEAICDLVGNFVSANGRIDHPLLGQNDPAAKTVVLVLTGNRGMCGSYNGNVMRLALRQIRQLRSAGEDFELLVSGRKGIRYLKYAGCMIDEAYTHFEEKTSYLDVKIMADEFIYLYSKGEIKRVLVIYTKLVSTVQTMADVFELLPIARKAKAELPGRHQVRPEQYSFSPGAQEILNELIPTGVCAGLFQCFLDAIASEQIARMNAMQAATENAEKMIGELSRQFNRARQSQITGELLDIVGGVEALQ